MSFYIEKAEFEDVSEIIEIYREQIKYHREINPSDYRCVEEVIETYEGILYRLIDDSYNAVFVARDNGRIIGYMTGRLTFKPPHENAKKTGEITDAHVLKEYRNMCWRDTSKRIRKLVC